MDKLHNTPLTRKNINYFNLNDWRQFVRALPAGLDISSTNEDLFGIPTPYDTWKASSCFGPVHLGLTPPWEYIVSHNICTNQSRVCGQQENTFYDTWKGKRCWDSYIIVEMETDWKYFHTQIGVWEIHLKINQRILIHGIRRCNHMAVEKTANDCTKMWRGQIHCLAGCMKEELWIRKLRGVLEMLFSNQSLNLMFRISMLEDNLRFISCTSDARSPRVSNLSKYADLKYRFLIAYITNGKVNTHYVPTNYMISNPRTNKRRKVGFEHWRS